MFFTVQKSSQLPEAEITLLKIKIKINLKPTPYISKSRKRPSCQIEDMNKIDYKLKFLLSKFYKTENSQLTTLA
ncbi:hypothetical protein TUM3792_24810 [Shewanella sp. MBTL60-007]|nr:hypothetical protein TUM3792_24810 [Shewanella sp. MBTL60-007]